MVIKMPTMRNSITSIKGSFCLLLLIDVLDRCQYQGRQTGGGVGGVSTPPEFWMGGLNACQPPLILRKNFLEGLVPLKLI